MTAGDDDWHEVVENLQKVRKSCGMLPRILSRGGRVRRYWEIFQGGDIGGVVVWGRDVGNNPQDRAGPE